MRCVNQAKKPLLNRYRPQTINVIVAAAPIIERSDPVMARCLPQGSRDAMAVAP
jgi:hypothetical protein